MPAGGLLAASALGPVLGGIIGQVASAGSAQQAQNAQQAAQNLLTNLPQNANLTPVQLSQLQQYASAGALNPALTSQSAVAGIQNQSPQLQAAQMGALNAFTQLGNTGLSATDQAALNQIQQQVNASNQGRIGQIQQQMASRGMAGSGADLAAQLSSAQSATNQQSNQAMQQGAQAQAARIAALGQQANLANQITGQQFGMNLTKAQAQDALNQFNNAQRNQAQTYNLQNAQNIANANTGMANQLPFYNNQLAQQQFGNQLNSSNMGIQGEEGLAGNYSKQAQNTAQSFSNIGSGLGSLAGSIGTAPSGSAFGQLFSSAVKPTPTSDNSIPNPVAGLSNQTYTYGSASGY
jgi:hypothetical protein